MKVSLFWGHSLANVRHQTPISTSQRARELRLAMNAENKVIDASVSLLLSIRRRAQQETIDV